MPSVVIADDHEIVRCGLRAVLRTAAEFQIVGEADDGLAALRLIARLQPDLVLIDVGMPGLTANEVARETTRTSPRSRVVVLSEEPREECATQAFRIGASGFLLKSSRAAEIVDALRQVAAGCRYVSAPLDLAAIERKARPSKVDDPYETLSAREREILRLAAIGQTSAQIAEQLFISRRTVESHRAHVMHKLGLRTHTDVVLFAVRRGIVAVD